MKISDQSWEPMENLRLKKWKLRFHILKQLPSLILLRHPGNQSRPGAINIDNTYELASSHYNDLKDLRADEDIVINQEWILNKLSENENE